VGKHARPNRDVCRARPAAVHQRVVDDGSIRRRQKYNYE
jgi:hypothetical protein